MGLSTIVTSITANRVYPSGGILATRAAAIAVLAPGWFSTTTGWPQTSLRRWATTRVRMSVGPPAGNGTTNLIERLGKASACSCAAAGDIANSADTNAIG